MPPPFNPAGAAQQQKKKLKAPAVLIAHYTAKGMDERAASQKVIEDLQKALAFSFESYPTQKVMMMDKVVKSNVESFHQRLSQIEAKVDSKPNLSAVFGAGVAAGGLVKLVWEGVPHVLQAMGQVTKDVKVSTSNSRV